MRAMGDEDRTQEQLEAAASDRTVILRLWHGWEFVRRPAAAPTGGGTQRRRIDRAITALDRRDQRDRRT